MLLQIFQISNELNEKIFLSISKNFMRHPPWQQFLQQMLVLRSQNARMKVSLYIHLLDFDAQIFTRPADLPH